jgi:uncharacterized protein YcbK (DUF882 family)
VPLTLHRPLASRRTLLGGLAGMLVGLQTGWAIAGTTRRLTLVRQSSGEVAYEVPFWRDGAPDRYGLAELNWLMRDIQAAEVRPIDLRIYYLLAMLQAEFGGRPIVITSGYRTKATNDRLRAQGLDAPGTSFHILGQATDVQIGGVPPARVGELGRWLGLGGVGIYETFVHLDTGPERFWQG